MAHFRGLCPAHFNHFSFCFQVQTQCCLKTGYTTCLAEYLSENYLSDKSLVAARDVRFNSNAFIPDALFVFSDPE